MWEKIGGHTMQEAIKRIEEEIEKLVVKRNNAITYKAIDKCEIAVYWLQRAIEIDKEHYFDRDNKPSKCPHCGSEVEISVTEANFGIRNIDVATYLCTNEDCYWNSNIFEW
jgi:predicted Zn-ribbon and HTH transcriptional regulator